MTLMEFSMIPLDKGHHFSSYVARILKIVDASGLSYRLTPMGTIVEGEWLELTGLLTKCMSELDKDCERISLTVRFDAHKGRKNMLESKIASVQEKAGKKLNT